jgi:hypothetical protein
MLSLRLYSPPLPVGVKRELARELTATALCALQMAAATAAITTIQFVSYLAEDFAIGGDLVGDGAEHLYFLEIAGLDLDRRAKEALARELTPVLGRLLLVRRDDLSKISLRFVACSQEDLAVGGRLAACEREAGAVRQAHPKSPRATADLRPVRARPTDDPGFR